ncbi:hypothetical protein ACMATS_24740 [Streptoverticillium reticulum]|uniref:hypothetical protein n=1 Tax=Streptoverticillium reticulum TaxID=1433415 RepID=UPI0039BF919A
MPPTDPAHLATRLQELLGDAQDLIAQHKAVLDQYRDADGNVIESRYTAYDDARITAAIEASDHLDTRLIGPPPPRTPAAPAGGPPSAAATVPRPRRR